MILLREECHQVVMGRLQLPSRPPSRCDAEKKMPPGEGSWWFNWADIKKQTKSEPGSAEMLSGEESCPHHGNR